MYIAVIGVPLDIIYLSSKKYLFGCALASAAFYWLGLAGLASAWLVASEIFLTILSLFVLGSFRYQLDKNALTYGAGLVILGTFIPLWWPHSYLQSSLASQGAIAWIEFLSHHFLTLAGLDNLVHADTMLFILILLYPLI